MKHDLSSFQLVGIARKAKALLAGIAYRMLQGYVGGENVEGMTGIAKAGVNLNWLVSGEGYMFQIAT